MRMRATIRTFAADARGTTAIEYSVIASGIACAIVVAVTTLGTSVLELWTRVLDAFLP